MSPTLAQPVTPAETLATLTSHLPHGPTLTNYNAPKGKSEHTRPRPLLTAAQLASSTRWVFPPRQADDFRPGS